MDAYHEVLVKLLEVTEGRDSKAVDFRDLVKKQGFLGNYPNIFQHLSAEGWIAEDRKADFVRITHWGIAEAKKSLKGDSGSVKTVSENAKKCLEKAKELVIALEGLAKDTSPENVKKAENLLAEVQNSLALAKKDAK